MNNIEDKSIESTTGRNSGKKIDYTKILGVPNNNESGEDKTTAIKEEEQKLFKAYEETARTTNTPSTPNKTPINIHTTIQNLNRPEAEKGIENSYTTIENTIKNSKNDKGIAGFFGKVMNKILG